MQVETILIETGRRKGDVKPAGEMQFHWSNQIPLQARAMVMADKTIFIAGPPDIVDEEEALKNLNNEEVQLQLAEQRAALEGKKGAILWAVSKEDGQKLAEYELKSLPVFDGMAVTEGQLFLSTEDGSVHCFSGQ